jgi:hypothetical protein
MRTLIAMALMCTLGAVTALALVHLGPRVTGLTIAVLAAGVVAAGLLQAVRTGPGGGR